MFNPENSVNPEEPVNPENLDKKDSPLDKLKASIHTVCKNIKEYCSVPEEWSKEYERLKNFLEDKVWEWEKFKESLKLWSVRKVKNAIRMINEWIINKGSIDEYWTGLDRWNEKDIQTAKKLADMWMDIIPSEYKNMRYRNRNEKKIITAENLVRGGIIKIENISKIWAYMDEWNKEDIDTAKELHDVWMEIIWSDQEYMKKWTKQKINNLRKFKEENGNSLDYIDVHPVMGEKTKLAICASNHDRFKDGIPESLLAK